jgi:hypothetical protein
VDSIASVSGRLAALEDEMKIIKGEVKQVLTEIRTAILVKDSPFEEDASPRAWRPVQVVPAIAEQPARVELVPPSHEQPEPEARPHASQSPAEQHGSAVPRHPFGSSSRSPEGAAWSLLTIASIATWAEEAVQRVGAQRLAILLDLCHASGYLTSDTRAALGRITELEVPAPENPPSPTDVTVLLRQLDALLQDQHRDVSWRQQPA